MSARRIVIVGSNFAGFTAALKLRESLPAEHEIVVLSKNPDFVFMPSLIWLPFGLRKREDLSFPLAPIYEKHKVVFKPVTVTALDLENRKVLTEDGEEGYDFLVIATGPKFNYGTVPGLDPRDGIVNSIFSVDLAERTALAFEEFVKDPGPVLIGGVQGASCFGAAYEFLFNTAYQLGKRHIKVPVSYVTAEPFLGHFGIGGFGYGAAMCEAFCTHLDIGRHTSVAIDHFAPGEAHLKDGRVLPFKFAMFAPPFLGVDAVRARTDITNPGGFVKVTAGYNTEKFPEVYAAGVAVALDPPEATPVPCGVPKTGYLSEEMAKVVAHNIEAEIKGGKRVELAPGAIDAKCVLDAGNTGIIMSSDHFLGERSHEWLIPGPEAHWAKLAFEKYFLATRKRGIV